MGVLNGRNWLRRANTESRPYICMRCETLLSVQHHSCPNCGSYDIRRAKWIEIDP